MQKNKFIHEDIKAVCNRAVKKLVACGLVTAITVGSANFAWVSHKNIACAQTKEEEIRLRRALTLYYYHYTFTHDRGDSLLYAEPSTAACREYITEPLEDGNHEEFLRRLEEAEEEIQNLFDTPEMISRLNQELEKSRKIEYSLRADIEEERDLKFKLEKKLITQRQQFEKKEKEEEEEKLDLKLNLEKELITQRRQFEEKEKEELDRRLKLEKELITQRRRFEEKEKEELDRRLKLEKELITQRRQFEEEMPEKKASEKMGEIEIEERKDRRRAIEIATFTQPAQQDDSTTPENQHIEAGTGDRQTITGNTMLQVKGTNLIEAWSDTYIHSLSNNELSHEGDGAVNVDHDDIIISDFSNGQATRDVTINAANSITVAPGITTRIQNGTAFTIGDTVRETAVNILRALTPNSLRNVLDSFTNQNTTNDEMEEEHEDSTTSGGTVSHPASQSRGFFSRLNPYNWFGSIK